MGLEMHYMAGSAVEFERSLFFELCQSNRLFIGFARQDPTFGLCTLCKINHDTNSATWPRDIVGLSDVSDDSDRNKKYYDLVSQQHIPGIQDDKRRVYIGKIAESSQNFQQDMSFLDDKDVGEIYLDYINDEWVRVQGMKPSFTFKLQDYLNESTPSTRYKYFFFNYDHAFLTCAEIEQVKPINYPTIRQDVKLMYSQSSKTIPTTDVRDIGELVRTVNILGETELVGLEKTFEFDLNLVNYNFFITTPEGIVIQDYMKYVETIVTNKEKVIIMAYPLPHEINRETGEVKEDTGRTGRVRITTGESDPKVHVYNESLPISSMVAPISDKHPPALPLNYLKSSTISKSVFDIVGINRVVIDEVWFCKRLDKEEEEIFYKNLGFGVEEITLDLDVTTTTKYVKTQDRYKAIKYHFDLVLIDKKLDNKTPCSNIYRQCFICYNPRNRYGELCLDYHSYVHEDLFDQNRHSYDIGTLLWISNSQPVYRKFIEEFEKFKILL